MNAYLSKSKQANPDDIAQARAYLQQEHNVVEFSGGQYNESILDECEIICIVPPGQNEIVETEKFFEINIGKGNFTEILAYSKRIPEGNRKVYLFKNNILYSIHKARITEVNWNNNWATLLLVK
jgi:hypothetical protein